MRNGIKVIIVLCVSIIICSGCIFDEDMGIPRVSLYDSFVDCNEDYIVEIREDEDNDSDDDIFVVDVTQEGKVVSQLQCNEYALEPEMVAVGRNGYYLLDKSTKETILVMVNFDSEIIAQKRVPSYLDHVFCRNGYVFLSRSSERYFDGIDADYFLAEDDFTQDIQVLTQENVNTLEGIAFYKIRGDYGGGYSTEPELKNHVKIFDGEGMMGKELLNMGKEYAVLRNLIRDEDECLVVEYQKGYQIYGWVNCCDESYKEAWANKELPPFSSITKGIAYKINTENGKTEILEEREEAMLFSSEEKIVYMQGDGKIFCYDRSQDKVKEIACIKAYSPIPHISFKKDLIILYDDNVIRY